MEVTYWTKFYDVPKTAQYLDGVALDLDQCNLIFKDLATEHAKPIVLHGVDPKTNKQIRTDILDPDFATAKQIFRENHEIKMIGNHRCWVAKINTNEVN